MCRWGMQVLMFRSDMQHVRTFRIWGARCQILLERMQSILVVLKGHPVEARRVDGNDGTVRYLFDQLASQASITFSPGGLYDESFLLHGRVATVSADVTSQS